MSSHRATNRHVDRPPDVANIRQPGTSWPVTDTDIPQEAYTTGARIAGRRRPADPRGRAAQLAAVHAAAVAAEIGLSPDIPAVVRRPSSAPDTISKITRNDVELFFDAAHAFRTNLAAVLPEIATRLGKFILAEPYTIIDASGHPVQTVPDVSAMTPAQAKLAGLVLHRLLPPITDMDIEGKPGLGKGNMIDARQVRITVNTVNNDAGDSTDRRLRAGAVKGEHPNAARRIAPITMNLGQVVDQAQALVGEIDGIDPETIAGTLPREPAAGEPDEDPYRKYAGVSGEADDDATDGQHDPPHPDAPE